MTTNDSIDDRLRESLAALSKPVETGEEPSLVHRALEEVESGSQRRAHGPADGGKSTSWRTRILRRLPAVALGVFLVALTIAVLVPAQSAARHASKESIAKADERMRAIQREMDAQEAAETLSALMSADAFGNKVVTPSAPPSTAPVPMAAMSKAAGRAEGGALADAATESARADQPRIILRTGSCEIRVEDVEVARHTVESLIRPELGEYVENASVGLDQSNPSATITVRIDSARFDEFMAALSGVGTVRSVSVDAADATDQIVDLEARIRNERRVEEEVLRLLENRQDAPLEDIVRVRRELSDVRESIERMEAHRQSILGRAELSTVRITLVGPEPKLEPGEDDSPSFSQRIGEAAADGWRAFTGSVVWIVEVFVAGLVWWIGAAVIIWLGVRHYRFTSSWR